MNIYELEKFRDKRYIFADRWDGGLTLASMIHSTYGQIKDGMVLAISISLYHQCNSSLVGLYFTFTLTFP
jgi:hypothetical protein